ncbi:MAG: peptide-methionine (S)-S-oxide reductase MsrA [Planctomycetota bacterium]
MSFLKHAALSTLPLFAITLLAVALLSVTEPSAAADQSDSSETKSLIVAGGCFWCVESDFDHVKGVVATTSGYAGGKMQNPTYKNHRGHREVLKIDYDPAKTDYNTLVTTFLRTIDPIDPRGQFCDRGHSYTTAIHAATDEERTTAEAALNAAADQLGKKLAVAIEGPVKFWRAEDYHQNYWQSQTLQLTRFGLVTRATAYKGYRRDCGREARVKKVWGSDAYRGVERH